MIRTQKWMCYGAVVPLMLVVACCTAVPTPEAPPAPVPTPAPAPVVTAPAKPWTDRALNAGAWRYDAASRMARFVPASGNAPLVTLACTGGAIRLTANMGSGAQPVDVALKTSSGTDSLRFVQDSSTIGAGDQRLDRIAFSRGRFALEAPHGHALTLPVQSELGRVIEDCRG
ncbi:hypothetical protein [Sphingopyxis sp. MWB1]|uniref:hypothetical protein n=1 Tax=Sphingopyxis sp. MWB1 TaxID=1537715 RepID=UPI000AA3DBCF|nr:hypothetical protein [Sphingopyxis sp. MWB1]